MDGRESLTLALLVRDEERTITEAVRSALAFVDEVVVRDTGSRDATAELALALGARVLSGRWKNDFAAARNQLLTACATDWVLMLDGDETLVEGGGDLARLVAAPGAAAYTVEIGSPCGFGRVERTWACRLFRPGPRTAYRYRVHELLEGVAPAQASPLRLAHTGFLPSRRYAKALRNLALLERDLGELPDDPYLLWRHGREMELLGRGVQAEGSFERMAGRLSSLDGTALARLALAPEMLSDWAEALADRNQAGRAVGLATRVVLAQPARPLARFVHARVLAAAGRERDAEQAARCLLEPDPGWRYATPEEAELIATHTPALLASLGAPV